MEQFFFNRIRK